MYFSGPSLNVTKNTKVLIYIAKLDSITTRLHIVYTATKYNVLLWSTFSYYIFVNSTHTRRYSYWPNVTFVYCVQSVWTSKRAFVTRCWTFQKQRFVIRTQHVWSAHQMHLEQWGQLERTASVMLYLLATLGGFPRWFPCCTLLTPWRPTALRTPAVLFQTACFPTDKEIGLTLEWGLHEGARNRCDSEMGFLQFVIINVYFLVLFCPQLSWISLALVSI